MAERLSRQKCLLFICDIQNIFTPKTYGYEGLLQTSEAMVKTANIFNIPMVITEQKPKVFGQTEKRLKQHINISKFPIIQKSKFSMIIPQVQQILQKHKQRRQVILIGLETQICVLQTFLDLKQKNYSVFIPVDGVTSMRSFQRTMGIKRLQKQGAILSTYESLAFQLLQTSKNQHFKEILSILKGISHEKPLSHL